jgi:hypothetical protein
MAIIIARGLPTQAIARYTLQLAARTSPLTKCGQNTLVTVL